MPTDWWASTGTWCVLMARARAYWRNSDASKFFPASWTISSGGPRYTSIQHARSASQVCGAEKKNVWDAGQRKRDGHGMDRLLNGGLASLLTCTEHPTLISGCSEANRNQEKPLGRSGSDVADCPAVIAQRYKITGQRVGVCCSAAVWGTGQRTLQEMPVDGKIRFNVGQDICSAVV